jgi:hypothetical protein
VMFARNLEELYQARLGRFRADVESQFTVSLTTPAGLRIEFTYERQIGLA